MRDPWFPASLILIVLLAVWLSIFGPMPDGFASWRQTLKEWQTLTGALVALTAVGPGH
jgi:hypothetical protein